MFKSIRTVVYKVADLQKAKDWYTILLGVKPYFDEPFYVGFNINDYELGLDPDMEDVSYGTSVVTYWQVDDIEQAKTDILNHDGSLYKDIFDVGGDVKVAEFKDPFGNMIGIIEDKSFKK